MNNLVTNIMSQKEMPSGRQQILAVLFLAWPAIVEQLMITAVQYVDTAMVGSLGSNATASVGITSSTCWLFNGVMAAVGVAFSVQVAQFVGAGQLERAKDVVRQSLLFNIIFGFGLAGIAVAISFQLPIWLGAEQAIVEDASAYFRIIGYSMPLLLTANIVGSIIRCTGDTKTPMVLNIFINIFNVIFNTLFIFPTRTVHLFGSSFTMWGAGMGVAGAGWGSALAEAIVGLLLLVVIFTRKSCPVRVRLRGEPYRLTRECMQQAARLGIPVALERVTMNLAQLVQMRIISGLGTIAVATNHLGVTAENLCFMPGFGISMAATTLVGQAVGAGKEKLAIRFSRISTYMGMIVMGFAAILMFIFAPQLIGIFSNDPEVIRLGSIVLRIEAFCEPMFAVEIVAGGAFRGAGDARSPFILNMVSMWLIRLPLIALAAGPFGLVGVWTAISFELCIRGVLFLRRLYSNKWLGMGIA